MATLIAIESSTNRASLALIRDNQCVFEDGFESDRNHNSLLFAPLQAALDLLGDDPLDLVVIGTGPGSYSGTRVGIAAGQGVALVHGCPAVGLPSLLATPVKRGIAIGDARRGSAWWAEVGDALPEPQLIDPADLASHLRDQPAVFSFENVTGLGLPEDLTVERVQPTAAALADAWLALPEETKSRLLAEPPQPVYLRPPHITMAKAGHPLLRKKD